MKTLEKGQDKIKKIAEELRHQTLEPAQKEAQELIRKAEAESEEIIQSGRVQAEKLIAAARQTIEHERKVFQSALTQSFKQTFEMLKQEIQTKLFNDQIGAELEKTAGNSEVIAKLIDVIVGAIQKEGTSADIAVVIPQKCDPKEISRLISKGVLEKLQNGPIDLGSFAAGVQVRLKDKKLTLDVTDKTLKEIIGRFVPTTFHEILFAD